MRHVVLSRFQGTLLAAALGETLAVDGCLERAKQSTAATTEQLTSPFALSGWHPGSAASKPTPQCAPWGKAAVECARVLTQAGRWSELEAAAIDMRLSAGRLAAGNAVAPSRSRYTPNMAECAIAVLPLLLFFHENETKQRQVLRQTIQLWQYAPDSEAAPLAVGYAIAQALRDQLHPLTLIPQTLTYLKESTASATSLLLDLISRLEQTHALVQQRVGLHAAIDQLRAKNADSGNEALALAFYCFLSTPNDLRLSLLRAARCGEAAPIVSALTGALSGSYNSLDGVPLVWRMDCPLPLLWELSNVELSQLATHLFAVWAGLYHPAMALSTDAIAAPGVIRPR